MRLGLVVDVGPHRASADRRPTSGRIDADVAHRREVDHDPVIDGREPGQAVTAAADRDPQIVAAREPDRRDDIGGAATPNYEGRRAAVMRAIPDPGRLRVAV